MKTRILKTLSKFLILPGLLLTACNPTMEKSVKVEINLDLQYIENDAKPFPTTLSGESFKSMIETKQSFVLYYYSANCAGCEKVTPYYNELLSKNSEGVIVNPFNIYSIQFGVGDFSYVFDEYKDLFTGTPKTMFFNNGELSLELSQARYKSYKVFESAMREFCIPTKIYTARKLKAINDFYTTYGGDEYLVYIKSDTKGKQQDYQYLTNNYYSQNVYPIIKDSKVPTLLLSTTYMEPEAKKTIFNKYSLSNEHSAIYVNKNGAAVFDYLDNKQSQDLISLLNRLNNK